MLRIMARTMPRQHGSDSGSPDPGPQQPRGAEAELDAGPRVVAPGMSYCFAAILFRGSSSGLT